MKINYNSKHEIKKLLQELNICLKKRWGQNFLINENARNNIINILNPEKEEKIWEIGPGIGSITEILLAKTDSLTVFEIDKGLIRFLNEYFAMFIKSEDKYFNIVDGDFLKTWEKELKINGAPDKIIGNLPYSSASAFIVTLIENNAVPAKMVFTVQKELAQRITAKTNTKSYSSFSVLCQYACTIKIRGDINSGSFFPKPDITSTIIEMTPNKRLQNPASDKIFLQLVKGLFSSRRKTIKNNIRSNITINNVSNESIYNAAFNANIDIQKRAEYYNVSDFINFSNEIQKIKLNENNL